MRLLRLLLTAAPLPLLTLASLAQQPTQAVVRIGGPGSCSSTGTCDPALISDGVTEASARLLFELDPGSGQLTLVVTNDSPVVPGSANPLLSRVYFNAPAAVTHMTLLSQSGSGTLQPSFEFSFSAVPAYQAADFGDFHARLREGLEGAIANPAADTLATDVVVDGHATFVFQLAGELAGMSAASFTTLFSTASPSATASQAAAKFVGGGAMSCDGGYINQGAFCDAVASTRNLGGGCGATLEVSAPIMGAPCAVTLDGNSPGGRALVMASLPRQVPFAYQGCDVFLNLGQKMMVRIATTDDAGDLSFEIASPSYADSPECCGVSFVVQAIVLSDAGPLAIGEITNAVEITLGS